MTKKKIDQLQNPVENEQHVHRQVSIQQAWASISKTLELAPDTAAVFYSKLLAEATSPNHKLSNEDLHKGYTFGELKPWSRDRIISNRASKVMEPLLVSADRVLKSLRNSSVLEFNVSEKQWIIHHLFKVAGSNRKDFNTFLDKTSGKNPTEEERAKRDVRREYFRNWDGFPQIMQALVQSAPGWVMDADTIPGLMYFEAERYRLPVPGAPRPGDPTIRLLTALNEAWSAISDIKTRDLAPAVEFPDQLVILQEDIQKVLEADRASWAKAQAEAYAVTSNQIRTRFLQLSEKMRLVPADFGDLETYAKKMHLKWRDIGSKVDLSDALEYTKAFSEVLKLRPVKLLDLPQRLDRVDADK